MGRKVWLNYDEYLKSDVWKCPKAPINPDIELQVANKTGAHHWIPLQGKLSEGTLCCIHCYDVRVFPLTWNILKDVQTISQV